MVGPPSKRRPTAAPAPSYRKTVDFALIGAARRIVESALSVVPGERVVVVFDKAREGIISALVDAVESVSARAMTFVVEDFGPRPLSQVPEGIERALSEAQASILLIGADDPAEQPFRRDIVRCVESYKLRHAHLIGMTRKALVAGFNLDPARIADMTRAVRVKLIGKTELHYRTAAGTNLRATFDPDVRWTESVGIIRPGRFENLPAGHLHALPRDVSGVYVADASLDSAFTNKTPSLLGTPPVRFQLDGGRCRAITSDDAALAEAVWARMSSIEHLDRVGQIVLGTHPGLGSPIGEPIFDQCVPGLHLVFGWSNPQASGATWVAQGIIGGNAAGGDLDVDGQTLLRGGRYIV